MAADATIPIEGAAPRAASSLANALTDLGVAVSAVASANAAFVLALDRGWIERHLGGLTWAAVGAFAVHGAWCAALLARRARQGAARHAARPCQVRFTFCALVVAAAFHVVVIGRTIPGVRPALGAAALAVFPLTLAADRAIEAIMRHRAARAVDFVAYCVCMAAVLGEAALQTVARVAPSPLFERKDLDTRSRERMFGLKPGQVRLGFACNSRGFFDEEFRRKAPGEERTLVASIGDSFSTGSVPHPFHFTTVAEGFLPGWEIANIGLSSAGPWDYLQYLREEALPLAPDLVLVNIFVGNDVVESLRVGPRADVDAWLSRGATLLYLVPPRIGKLGGVERLETAPASVPAVKPVAPVIETSSVFGVAVKSAEQLRAEDVTLDNPLFERGTFSESAFMGIEKERARRICGEEIEAFHAFDGFLDAVKAAAGSTRLAVMLIPDEFQVDDELWGAVRAQLVKTARGSATAWDRDRPQRILVKSLTDRGIPYLDLLPVLRSVPPLSDGKLHCYLRRDTHWNARGNRIAGAALGEFLRSLVN